LTNAEGCTSREPDGYNYTVFDLSITYLFCDENGKVPILLIDLSPEGEVSHEEDTKKETPHCQLPVAEVIEKTTVVLH